MKTSKFTEEICRKLRISEATFYIYGLLPKANGG